MTAQAPLLLESRGVQTMPSLPFQCSDGDALQPPLPRPITAARDGPEEIPVHIPSFRENDRSHSRNHIHPRIPYPEKILGLTLP